MSILKKIGWAGSFTSLKTPYVNLKQRKSKTELFSELITEFGDDTSKFIGIGDMKFDCIAAKDNNITAIGVLWGSGTEEELSACCDYIFEDTKQLCNFLYERK
jgi:phosphoglycolate phosphatase